jgi:hypothetical protein
MSMPPMPNIDGLASLIGVPSAAEYTVSVGIFESPYSLGTDGRVSGR